MMEKARARKRLERRIEYHLRSTSGRMRCSLSALSDELNKFPVLFEEPSAGMLDHIIIWKMRSGCSDGVNFTCLGDVAGVTLIDSTTLSVVPHDPNALEDIKSAIVSSLIGSRYGLNPIPNGEELIVSIPMLTEEHINASFGDFMESINDECDKGLYALDLLKTEAAQYRINVERFEDKINEISFRFVRKGDQICRREMDIIHKVPPRSGIAQFGKKLKLGKCWKA